MPNNLSLVITGSYKLLQPRPWCENTTLLHFQHAAFDTRGENFAFVGEQDKVRSDTRMRHREALYSFVACCFALGLERRLPWEERSPFGRLPLEVIMHIMSLFTPLWAVDADSRAAGASYIMQHVDTIDEMIKARLPIILTEWPMGHRRLGFKLTSEKFSE
jgi:hypothetical protein